MSGVTLTDVTAVDLTSYGITGCNNVTAEDVTLDGGGKRAYNGCTGAVITRNVIVNHQTGTGQAFHETYGTATNCTVVGNKTVIEDGSLDLDSCIVTGNDRFGIGWGDGTAVYSLLQPDAVHYMTIGEGNLIGYLPRFVDAAAGDYNLCPRSPAIDAGNPALSVPPEGGARVDMGAVEYDAVADAATPPTVSITTPDTSDFSPAFVEGTISTDVKTVTWSTDTNSGDATVTTAGKFWMDVPLSATAETSLTVTASDGVNQTDATQYITWDVIDIINAGESLFTIRKDDELLLTGTGTGVELEINADGIGEPELDNGVPGQKLDFTYSSGDYSATATLKDSEGEVLSTASIYVTVVGVDLHGPVACQVGYTREHAVTVTPAGESASVAYQSSDDVFLQVGLKEYTADGAVLELTPQCRATPVIEARLGTSGPIIATQEVDEFRLDNTAAYFFVVHPEGDEGGRSGYATLTMSPLISDLSIEMWVCAPGLTFDGGVTTHTVSTNDFEAQPDATGTYEYWLHLAPGYDAICVNMDVIQESSPKHTIGIRRTDNGPVLECTCSIQRYTAAVVIPQGTTKNIKFTYTWCHTCIYDAPGHSVGKNYDPVFLYEDPPPPPPPAPYLPVAYMTNKQHVHMSEDSAGKHGLITFTIKGNAPGTVYVFGKFQCLGCAGFTGYWCSITEVGVHVTVQ